MSDGDEIVWLPVSNYYGTPAVVKDQDGDCHMFIEDWSDSDVHPISADFFEACKKEFGLDLCN